MSNLSGISWMDVLSVADPGTTIYNFDGFVNGQEAFKIDAIDDNAPLIFEGMIADGIFKTGPAGISCSRSTASARVSTR